MQTQWASVIVCDSAGEVGIVPTPDGTQDNVIRIPDGWVSSHAQSDGQTEFIVVRLPDGREFTEFCPNCQTLPAHQLLSNVVARNPAAE